LIFDPPGHRRLPIDDDELVDRALAIQLMAARSVTLLTYDTGQSTRARAKLLNVVKIADPPKGEEPPRRRSKDRGASRQHDPPPRWGWVGGVSWLRGGASLYVASTFD